MLALVTERANKSVPRPLLATLALFSVAVVASTLTAQYPEYAHKQFDIYVNWVIAVALIAITSTTERRWFLFVVLFLMWSLKMSQHGFLSWASRGFSFTSWGVSGSPGWFQNSGEFALQMGVFVPLSVRFILAIRASVSRTLYWGLWFLPISGIGSIIASSSRGGLVALVVVGLAATLRSKRRMRSLLLLALGLPVIWLMIPAESKARFQTAGEDATSLSRFTYWQNGLEMARDYPLFGVGYANWVPYYRDHYLDDGNSIVRRSGQQPPVVEVAHNSFIEVLSQLGYFGLLCFVAVIGTIPVLTWQARRALTSVGNRGRFLSSMSVALDEGVLAFCVAGYFMSVAFYPFIWIQLGMAGALFTASRRMRAEAS